MELMLNLDINSSQMKSKRTFNEFSVFWSCDFLICMLQFLDKCVNL